MRSVRKWEIGTSGKNLGMTRHQIDMEKDECVLAHITHQTEESIPRAFRQTCMAQRAGARPNRALGPCILRNAVTFHTEHSVARPAGKAGAWGSLGRTWKEMHYRKSG